MESLKIYKCQNSCQNLGKAVSSIGKEGLTVTAGFETYMEDFLELKGKFCQETVINKIL